MWNTVKSPHRGGVTMAGLATKIWKDSLIIVWMLSLVTTNVWKNEPTEDLYRMTTVHSAVVVSDVCCFWRLSFLVVLPLKKTLSFLGLQLPTIVASAVCRLTVCILYMQNIKIVLRLWHTVVATLYLLYQLSSNFTGRENKICLASVNSTVWLTYTSTVHTVCMR